MPNQTQMQHQKPTQKALVKQWLLAGERLDVMSIRKRTGNYAFHLFGRINELKNDGFVFDWELVNTQEGSPYKIIFLHADFVKDIQDLGLARACDKELTRRQIEQALEA